ncbi:hypothetical protein DPMN_123295 [Dreissena polymorpha]|uniref:Uncharacterized protein n=1 Tax=Dreissena polymorpha TaxID=45954 RepID=A0A9D4GU61_DREPO|nr:hypothetical protein DPMN_123295 [Dreissena polymorpha]
MQAASRSQVMLNAMIKMKRGRKTMQAKCTQATTPKAAINSCRLKKHRHNLKEKVSLSD